MKKDRAFLKNTLHLAVPVTLQSMLQSSFSMVDQIMIGDLGSVSVAGVGLAGRFASIFSVLASAVGAIAGIMISQYLGQKNQREVRRSFYVNLAVAGTLAVLFTLLSLLFPETIMGFYTQDAPTLAVAASYLKLISATFLPAAGAALLSALFRCMEKAALPLCAGIVGALVNTALNYGLIYGKWGFPAMGADGAALATLISQIVMVCIMLILLCKYRGILAVNACPSPRCKFNFRQYAAMLLPMLVCECMWSLGENVYAAIYGHLGSQSCAAMTLTNPVQGLTIGALCGLSQAAGVIVGKQLGTGREEEAYLSSCKLLRYGLVSALCLSIVIVLLRTPYVQIYRVEPEVRQQARQILLVYAAIAPVKVLNMILGSGILRSGGKTKYVMAIDLMGTWLLGVPLGLIAAFVLRLSIPWVYLLLSLEECARLLLAMRVFVGKKWMHMLEN